MRYLRLLPVLVLLGCGGGNNSTSAPEEPVAVAEPVSDTGDGTDTGSTQPEIKIAQANPHPRYYRYSGDKAPGYSPIIITTYGIGSDESIDLKLDKPPQDLTPCNSAILLGEGMPVLSEKYQYDSWWIVASTTAAVGWQNNKKVYLYWAKQLSDKNEVGLVPIDTDFILTDPKEIKLDLGFAKVPYQWMSRIDNFSSFPVNPEEPCEK